MKRFFVVLGICLFALSNIFSQGASQKVDENRRNLKKLVKKSDQVRDIDFTGCKVEIVERIRRTYTSVTRYTGFNRSGLPNDGFGNRSVIGDEQHIYYTKRKVTFNLADIDGDNIRKSWVTSKKNQSLLFLPIKNSQGRVTLESKKTKSSQGFYSFTVKTKSSDAIIEAFRKEIQQCK